MISKIKTLFWYLKNPRLLPDARQKIKAKIIYGSRENSGAKAKAWCSSFAISQEEAFARIFPGRKFEIITERFPTEYKYANEQEAKSQFVMGGAGAIDLLYNVCEASQSCQVIETGVAYGWSTFALLLSLASRNNSKLVSIDMPYAKMGNEDFVGTVVPGQLKEQWTLIRESDYTGLPKAISILKDIDLCHYDSDKSYLGRRRSYPLIWNALKSGGIFISDDIGDNIGFKEFCESINQQPVIISWNNKYIGILKK